jgi:hypothetical protein
MGPGWELQITDLPDAIGYHRDRAERFWSHATHSKRAETREMYLRLARAEAALAGHFEQQLRATDVVRERQEMDQPK